MKPANVKTAQRDRRERRRLSMQQAQRISTDVSLDAIGNVLEGISALAGGITRAAGGVVDVLAHGSDDDDEVDDV